MTGRLCAHGRSILGDCALCVAGNPAHGSVRLWVATCCYPHKVDKDFVVLGVFSTEHRAKAETRQRSKEFEGAYFETHEIELDESMALA